MHTIHAAPEPVAVESLPAMWSAAYEDLKLLARARLRRDGRTVLIDTTALVNESFLRVFGKHNFEAQSRLQFFAYAARVMRSVIVDMAREQMALRRGGDVERVALTTTVSGQLVQEEPVRVDEALNELGKFEPRLVEVVQMRYFGGMSDTEIAEVLDVSERTVGRSWQKARLLLKDMLAN
jgi:RNA polymerase sigma factor (TIGR02999 family)